MGLVVTGEDAGAGVPTPRRDAPRTPRPARSPRSWWARRRGGDAHVSAQVDFAMDGPCGTDLPARLWRSDGRLTLALDLDEAPDPDSTLVRALHAGLLARRMVVDLVHGKRVVLVLGGS